MASKIARRGLGRGLTALIPESDIDLLNNVARGDAPALPIEEQVIAPVGEQLAEADGAKTPSADIRYISIESVEANPFQPRQIFSEEELENLAASIKEHGVLQPILVRPLAGSRFQLVAGERRWRAATRAGLAVVPALVRDVDDQSSLELAIIENVQRHDISAIESAQAYVRLAKEFGLTGESIASKVGKSRASVANTMRLLDLPEDAINAIREGKISEGHGRALLTASGEGARRALLRRTLRDGLSVRDVERLAREAEEAGEVEKGVEIKLPRAASTDMVRLESTLQRALGARLKLKPKKRGGQIIIDFSSPEELSRLVKRMTRPEIASSENTNSENTNSENVSSENTKGESEVK